MKLPACFLSIDPKLGVLSYKFNLVPADGAWHFLARSPHISTAWELLLKSEKSFLFFSFQLNLLWWIRFVMKNTVQTLPVERQVQILWLCRNTEGKLINAAFKASCLWIVLHCVFWHSFSQRSNRNLMLTWNWGPQDLVWGCKRHVLKSPSA